MLGAISLIVDNFESLSRFVAGITHVLEFKGEGAWELYAAADFRFDS